MAHGQDVIHEFLGVDPSIKLAELWADAVGVAQGELTAGLGLTKTARINYWAALLHLDIYRRAFEGLLPVARVFRDRKTAAGAAVSSYKDTLGTMPVGVSTDECAERVQELELDLKAVTEILGELVAQREVYLEAQRKMAGIDALIPRLADQIVEAQEAQARLPDMDVLQAEHDRLQQALLNEPAVYYQEQIAIVARLKAECQQLARDVQSLGEELDVARTQVVRHRALSVDLLDNQMALQEEERKATALMKEAISLKAQQEHPAKRLNALSDGGGDSCPTCRQPLSLELRSKIAEEAVLDLENLEARRKEMLSHHRHAVGRVNLLKQERAGLADEVMTLATQDTVDDMIETFAQMEEQYSQRCGELTVAQGDLERLVVLHNESEERKGKYNELHIELVRAQHDQEQVSKLSSLLDEMTSMRQEMKVLREVVFDTQAHGEAMALRDESVVKLAEANQVLETASRVDRLRQRLVEEERAYSVADQAVGLLSRARNTIRDAGPALTELKMRALIQAARVNYEYLQQSPERLYWTGDFEAGLGDRPFNLLSGGEKVGVALALRLAIAHLEADLSFLVLDEPTIHLDTGARAGLADMISRLTLEQTIVVTHDGAFAPYVDQVIEL
jgi:DNA repair exonuclease SbcCD ATPase subunit